MEVERFHCTIVHVAVTTTNNCIRKVWPRSTQIYTYTCTCTLVTQTYMYMYHVIDSDNKLLLLLYSKSVTHPVIMTEPIDYYNNTKLELTTSSFTRSHIIGKDVLTNCPHYIGKKDCSDYYIYKCTTLHVMS